MVRRQVPRSFLAVGDLLISAHSNSENHRNLKIFEGKKCYAGVSKKCSVVFHRKLNVAGNQRQVYFMVFHLKMQSTDYHYKTRSMCFTFAIETPAEKSGYVFALFGSKYYGSF